MSREEDLVRSTTRAIASAVREVPPLRLEAAADQLGSEARAVRGRGAANHDGAGRTRSWRSWLVPATVAVGVVAIAIALAGVRSVTNDSVVNRPPAASANPASPSGVPAYYVALTRATVDAKGDHHNGILVGETQTGKTLKTFPSPAHTVFASVTGAADDRTFVVFALKDTASRGSMNFTGSWYLVRLDPVKAGPPVLTRLPVKPQTVHGYPELTAFATALSGSGRELAVTEATASGGLAVKVFSVTTGQLLHDWTTNDPSISPGTSFPQGISVSPILTWIDGDQVLALNTHSAGPASKSKNPFLGFGAKNIVRELNVAGPASGDLLADSKVVWDVQTWEYPVTPLESCTGQLGGTQLISADGTTLGCAALARLGPGPDLSFLTYPLTTGTAAAGQAAIQYQVLLHLGKGGGFTQKVLWISPSGDALIGGWTTIASDTVTGLHIGVMSHGKFTPLRFPPGFAQEVTIQAISIAW